MILLIHLQNFNLYFFRIVPIQANSLKCVGKMPPSHNTESIEYRLNILSTIVLIGTKICYLFNV